MPSSPEIHSVLLYNEDRTLHIQIWYFGFTKEQILEDVKKRHSGRWTKWTQFKYCD